jgi:hypothetical protein
MKRESIYEAPQRHQHQGAQWAPLKKIKNGLKLGSSTAEP